MLNLNRLDEAADRHYPSGILLLKHSGTDCDEKDS